MQKIKKATPYITIFFVSFLIFLLWGQFNSEAYLIDDNRTQWFPVIERAYADFFKTGKIPVYDFFQFKGFSVAEQGYYGIMNPIMMIAYVLSHFTPLPFSTITIYLAVLFSLGNVCFSALCLKLKCNTLEMLLLTYSYAGIASFVSFSYWYYIYNNYLIIPLMLLILLKSRKTKWEYFSVGIVLAFDILLGNVQYTCYHYMIYVLVCIIYAIFDNKRYFKVMLANLFVAGIFSSPFLLMLLNASGGFHTDEFLNIQLTFKDLLIGSFIPVGFLNRIFDFYEELFVNCMGRDDYTWLFNGTFTLYWIFILFYFLKYVFKNKKKIIYLNLVRVKQIYDTKIVRKDKSHVFIIAVTVVLIYFISFVTGGPVAKALYKVPVIKNFRHLFKCLFVIEPVFAVLTAAIMPLFRRRLHKAVPVVMAVLAVIGIINNAQTFMIVSHKDIYDGDLTISEETEYGKAQIETSMPDMDSYRYCTVLLTRRFLPDSFRYYYSYLRNFPTTAGVYSLAGYEMSIPQEKLLDIYQIQYFSRLFGAVIYPDLLDYISKNPEKLQETIYSNGVKYILVEKKFMDGQDYQVSNYTPSLMMEELERNGIEIEEKKELNEYYDILVIKNPQGLCTSEKDDVIPISSDRMDTVSFNSNGSKSFTLAFYYDKHLTAYIETKDGNKTSLGISPDENGHIILHNPSNLTGTVTISFGSALYNCGFVCEAIIFIMLISLLVILFRDKNGLPDKSKLRLENNEK